LLEEHESVKVLAVVEEVRCDGRGVHHHYIDAWCIVLGAVRGARCSVGGVICEWSYSMGGCHTLKHMFTPCDTCTRILLHHAIMHHALIRHVLMHHAFAVQHAPYLEP
jgi:hypothetical protein